ncbi:hypothetical protein SUGI_0628640 [Cryptomeria japonica]|nr:hypothetical protein SUGI_0628640 [Cryptomeria japonica]
MLKWGSGRSVRGETGEEENGISREGRGGRSFVCMEDIQVGVEHVSESCMVATGGWNGGQLSSMRRPDSAGKCQKQSFYQFFTKIWKNNIRYYNLIIRVYLFFRQ